MNSDMVRAAGRPGEEGSARPASGAVNGIELAVAPMAALAGSHISAGPDNPSSGAHEVRATTLQLMQ